MGCSLGGRRTGRPDPYGTETMHVLRAEKGYPIIGQDTDGTITPQDLGMGWAVSKKKVDYIGKRSHTRPDNSRPDRKHLVGLLPHDPTMMLPEGSQLVDVSGELVPPVPMLGHVTSSYPSAALNSTFALALLMGGRDRLGSTVYVVVDGKPVPTTVTSSVLVDPEGLRRDGDPAGDGDALQITSSSLALPISPLSRWADALGELSRRPAGNVRIGEQPLTTMLNLRIPAGSGAAAAFTTEFGVPLPTGTGTVTSGDGVELLGLGPDEFLLLAGPGQAAHLQRRLAACLFPGRDTRRSPMFRRPERQSGFRVRTRAGCWRMAARWTYSRCTTHPAPRRCSHSAR